ncbi:MAG: hypothetical protein AB7K24_12675 [Gemmataceae bacterium]
MKRALLSALLCLPALLSGVAAPAQEPDQQPAEEPARVVLDGQGNHVLRFLLWEQGLESLQSIDDLAVDPENTLLIVLGDAGLLDDVPQLFASFVKGGGAVMIASDRGSPRIVESMFQIESHDDVPVSTTDNAVAYKETYPKCPVIPTAGPERCVNLDHPIFRGLAGKGIATNLPGFVDVPRGAPRLLQPTFIAWFPPSCKAIPHRLMRLPSTVERLHFAAVCPHYGSAPILFLSDHSVFINSMMLQDDNDNLQFAANTVSWLTAKKEGKRTRVLLLDEGQPVTKLEVNVKEGQIPPIPDEMELANAACKVVQAHEPGKQSYVNALFAELFPAERVQAGAAILVTCVLLVYGFYRLALARQQT